MSLMSLVRWIGVLVIGWTLVAIGIGATGSRLSVREATTSPRAETPLVEAMPTNWPAASGYDLVDRTSGRRTPIRLPDGDRWPVVSVAPWRAPGGELEAVGRWVNPGREDFSGWAIFRLSDGAVTSRIATEVLPTGRPCWIPGQGRTIVFAAGDGRLYRCRRGSEDGEASVPHGSTYASGRAEPSEPLAWLVSIPGFEEPILEDPVWPSEARLKRWVFVALMPMEKREGRRVWGAPQLWWLELSDDAGAIVAAGRLTDRTASPAGPDRIDERFPDVAVGSDGDIRLVFLERRNREKGWRLRSSPIEFDSRTGRPRAVVDPSGPALDSGEVLQSAPLLVSADGATVHALSSSGRLAALPVVRPGNSGGRGASLGGLPSRP